MSGLGTRVGTRVPGRMRRGDLREERGLRLILEYRGRWGDIREERGLGLVLEYQP